MANPNSFDSKSSLSVGGTADFSIEADAVRYRLVVPADQFET